MPEKKLLRRSEKYITERVSKKGTHSLEVCIRVNGQAFRKSIKMDDFPTPAAALDSAVRLRDDILLKMRAGQKVTGFPTVRRLYEDSYNVLPVAIKTRYRHDIYFRMAFQPYADTPIDKITAADIQECLNRYAQSHTRKETGKMLAVWRRLYKVAAMKDISISDKTVGVQLPKGIQGKHRSKEISLQDFETFCEALLGYNATSVSGSYNSYAIYYMLRIMQYCGLRPAETLALMRSDVDLDRNIIRVEKAAHSTISSPLEISSTKTEQSIRAVPIPAQLRPILEECLAWSRHDVLLARYNGDLWDISDVDTLIGNVRQKCGVYFVPYMLRHMFSTDLFAQGTPAPVIRDLMGHESESMSLDYAVSDPADREKALNDRKFTKK